MVHLFAQTQISGPDYIMLIGYFALMLGIGLYFYRFMRGMKVYRTFFMSIQTKHYCLEHCNLVGFVLLGIMPAFCDAGVPNCLSTRMPLLMPDDLEQMHVYYGGTEGIHGEIFDTRVKKRLKARGETTAGSRTPTLPFASALCRATWDFDRLWALVPSAGGPVPGIVVTRPCDCAGKQLWVNVKAKARGSLRVELITEFGEPVPGFSYAECEALKEDHHRVKVRWKGGDRAPQNSCKVAFCLTRTFLYGFEWKE